MKTDPCMPTTPSITYLTQICSFGGEELADEEHRDACHRQESHGHPEPLRPKWVLIRVVVRQGGERTEHEQ